MAGETSEGGYVRPRVRLCDEPVGKLAILLAEGLKLRTMATHAFLTERG